ncbi:MAG TPA: hypothetical protein VG246_07450 [Acidimicrobiales bacterium]|nr:hypothetical protein [Acidimicrobiales bacterium]
MKFLRNVVVLVALAALVFAVPASAVTVPWQHAKEVALPKGSTGIPDGFLPSLSCVSARECVAGGDYTTTAGATNGLIVSETNGTWRAPITLVAPVGANVNPDVTIFDVSCGAAGNCAAVGSYEDSARNIVPFTANEVNGKWLRSRELTLPKNAIVNGQSGELRAVECSSAYNCSAVGEYFDNYRAYPRSQGFVATEVRGHWSIAREVLIAQKTNFNPFVTFAQLACSSLGNCVGVGSFIDAHDVTEGLVVSQVRGVWHKGEEVSVPANASAFSGASLSEVTCLARSTCDALGTFISQTGALEAMATSGANGAWGRAVELTMPAGANANPHVFLFGFDGIACASSGNCSAGGQYKSSTGAYQGFLANEVNGAWSPAVEMALPAGGRSGGQNGGVVALACPAVGECQASGSYLDTAGAYQAVTLSEIDGVWQRGVKVTLPSSASTVGVDGGIYDIVCPTPSSCVGVGSYLKGGADYEGFTLQT